MIPMDHINHSILLDEFAQNFLSQTEMDEFKTISYEERQKQLKDILEKPIKIFTPVNELYFRQRWAGLVQKWCSKQPITFLEIASGDADMIPQALACCPNQTKYISANMNAALNKSLLEKTKDLNIGFQLIDDDAANIGQYIASDSVDIIGFQHGVNDVLQAILCGEYGVDTIHSDWMEILPQMIEILQTETKNQTFENKVKAPFLALIDTLSKTLKPDGLIAINHYMFQLDLDLGYPPELFEYLVPIIRKWFQEETNYREIIIEGFEANWWLFLQK